MAIEALRVAVGFALMAAAGESLLPWAGGLRAVLDPGRIAFASAAGLAAMVPAVTLLGLLGFPLFGWSFMALALVIVAVGRSRRVRRRAAVERSIVSETGTAGWAYLSVLVAFTVFAWKIAAVPLWSWDHYAIWGMKARRIITAGLFDLHFLAPVSFVASNRDYPVGLPVMWRVLLLGAEPTAIGFKVCHVLFGACVLATLYRLLADEGVPNHWATALTGIVALSPLFWDTEALGVAEMPLCWIALVSLWLLRGRLPGAGSGWRAGLVLGFLPWVKKEGLCLAVLLLGVAVVAARARKRENRGWIPLLAAFAVAAGATAAVQQFCLPRGASFLSTSFFAGEWWPRVISRVGHLGPLVSAITRELLVSDWLYFWPAFAAAFAVAAWRRNWLALSVFGVVLGQTLFYFGIYLGTYLDPVTHVEVSFFRLMGPLLPLATFGIGVLTRVSPSPSRL